MFYEGEVFHLITKAGLQGLSTCLLTGALYGGSGARIGFGSTSISLCYYTATIGAQSSVLTDVVQKVLDSELHIAEKAKDNTAQGVGMVLSALTLYGCMTLVEPISANQMGMTLMAVGASSEWVANYANSFIPVE